MTIFREALNENKNRITKAMPRSLKNKIMNEIYKKVLTNKTFKEIPISKISEIFEKHGAVLLQEDYTPWAGFLLGSEGSASIMIGDKNLGHPLSEEKFNSSGEFWFPQFKNAWFQIQWYKLPSGNYEITAYIS